MDESFEFKYSADQFSKYQGDDADLEYQVAPYCFPKKEKMAS